MEDTHLVLRIWTKKKNTCSGFKRGGMTATQKHKPIDKIELCCYQPFFTLYLILSKAGLELVGFTTVRLLQALVCPYSKNACILECSINRSNPSHIPECHFQSRYVLKKKGDRKEQKEKKHQKPKPNTTLCKA